MNDTELDQLLNRWESPEPSRGFRARVLAALPRREQLRIDGPLRSVGSLRWAAAMVAVVCMLAIGAAQSGGSALQNVGDGINRLHVNTINWIGDIWVGHIVDAFRNSNPSIYIDGDLRTDAEFGGSGIGVWLRIPGEGKYYIGMRRTAFEGPLPPRSGRFDGHVIELTAGAHSVRIESRKTYGFHQRLPVYVRGPVAGR